MIRRPSSPDCSESVDTCGTSSGRILTGGRAGDGANDDDAEPGREWGVCRPSSRSSALVPEPVYRSKLLLRGRLLFVNTPRILPSTAELLELDRLDKDGRTGAPSGDSSPGSSGMLVRAASDNDRPRPCRVGIDVGGATTSGIGEASATVVVMGGAMLPSGREPRGEAALAGLVMSQSAPA